MGISRNDKAHIQIVSVIDKESPARSTRRRRAYRPRKGLCAAGISITVHAMRRECERPYGEASERANKHAAYSARTDRSVRHNALNRERST